MTALQQMNKLPAHQNKAKIPRQLPTVTAPRMMLTPPATPTTTSRKSGFCLHL